MADLHELRERLRPETIDLHRAINSMKEELDAIDWYQQRVNASEDGELRAVLAHNRDEEIEHFAMVLEWVRRNHAFFGRVLDTYLFTEGDLTAIEAESEGKVDEGAPAPTDGP